MNAENILVQIKSFDWKKHHLRIKEFTQKKPIIVGLSVVGVLLVINLFGLVGEKENRVIERGAAVSFQNGRILNDRESTFYYGKE
ncbi:MAG: hypothetical protein ACK5V3_05735, partial [Bdellovibrionales bacterium]